MRTVALLASLFALSAVCGVFISGAQANPREVESRRADLEQVRERLRELESVIAETEASRSDAAQGLAEVEREVSRVQRALREVAAERESVQDELATREAERAVVETRIAERQDELGDWLRRQYMHGNNDVAPFLSGRDPNRIARDAHYLEHLGRARFELIEGLRADLDEQRRLLETIREREARLVALEEEHARRQREVEAVQAKRATALAELSGRLRSQEREFETLRENERELGRVIDVLVRQAAQREQQASGPRQQATIVPRSGEAVVGKVGRIAVPSGGVPFQQLRGRLGFPVQGELIGRFGAPRAESGTRWRGLFIRAEGGNDVVAIAAGEIVFSDWMRGYGNLIIVDHGNEFLSIYGNNDALLKVVGERVDGGVPIASVGASGGVRESGLYFELRHKGEPVDPMQWLRGS